MPFRSCAPGCCQLGRLANPNERSGTQLANYNSDADRIATPYPSDADEAMLGSPARLSKPVENSKTPFLQDLANPEHVSFESR